MLDAVVDASTHSTGEGSQGHGSRHAQRGVSQHTGTLTLCWMIFSSSSVRLRSSSCLKMLSVLHEAQHRAVSALMKVFILCAAPALTAARAPPALDRAVS